MQDWTRGHFITGEGYMKRIRQILVFLILVFVIVGCDNEEKVHTGNQEKNSEVIKETTTYEEEIISDNTSKKLEGYSVGGKKVVSDFYKYGNIWEGEIDGTKIRIKIDENETTCTVFYSANNKTKEGSFYLGSESYYWNRNRMKKTKTKENVVLTGASHCEPNSDGLYRIFITFDKILVKDEYILLSKINLSYENSTNKEEAMEIFEAIRKAKEIRLDKVE